MSIDTFTVVKIGGSLFSDKFTDRCINEKQFDTYADLISQLHQRNPGQMAVVSGGGSYGHQAVRQMDHNKETDRLHLTHFNFKLKWLWHQALEKRNIRCFPIQMAAQAIYKGQGQFDIHHHYFETLLKSGYLPLLSGDSLLDHHGHIQLVGSDIIPGFCQTLNFTKKRAIIMTDVPGVLRNNDPNSSDNTIAYIDQHSNLKQLLWPTKSGDTSGQMLGKVTALLNHAKNGIQCVIAKGEDCVKYQQYLLKPTSLWPREFKHTIIGWHSNENTTAGERKC